MPDLPKYYRMDPAETEEKFVVRNAQDLTIKKLARPLTMVAAESFSHEAQNLTPTLEITVAVS